MCDFFVGVASAIADAVMKALSFLIDVILEAVKWLFEGAMSMLAGLAKGHQDAFTDGVVRSANEYRDGKLNLQPIVDALTPLLLLIGTTTAVVMIILYLLIGMTFGLAGLVLMGVSLMVDVAILCLLSGGAKGKENLNWLSGMNPLALMPELRSRYDPEPSPWDYGLAIASGLVGLFAIGITNPVIAEWMGLTFALLTLILLVVTTSQYALQEGLSEWDQGVIAVLLLLFCALGGVGSYLAYLAGPPGQVLGAIGVAIAFLSGGYIIALASGVI